MPTALMFTLAFFTVRQPQIRHLPTCVYLAYLAVVDNGVLLLRGGRLLTISIFGEAYDDVLGCLTFPFLTNVLMQISAWLVVVIASERCVMVSIKANIKVKDYSQFLPP